MFTKKPIFRMFFVLLVVLMMTSAASASPLYTALGTGFTYQGKLTDGGAPANGAYDLEFKLYDALTVGSQVGSTVTKGDVTVTAGVFTVQLDFGDVFNGTALYLEIGVRPGSDSGVYTPLTPRQPLSAAPYALYANNADLLDNQHASYFQNASNTNAGTLGAGFFSAYSDLGAEGYLANAAGDLALNNGTLQTTLNADLLDGQHASYFTGLNHWGQTWSGSGIGLTLTSSGGGSTSQGIHATGDYAGIMGESPTTGYIGVYGGGPNGVFAHSNKADGNAIYASAYNATSSAGYFEGNVSITGNLTVGGTKSAVVDTKDYGTRTLYAIESPQNWFEDFGTGQLTNGAAVVTIEPVFAETVNLTEDYHVFLNPLGDCALYLDEKSPTSFTVRAIGGQTCSIAFDYRIIAKRFSYEDVRLAEVDNTPPVEESPSGGAK